MAVRYVAVPRRLAPGRANSPNFPAPADVLDGLAAQLDLRQLPSDPALLVYENTAWGPLRSAVDEVPAGGLGADLSAARPVLPGPRAQPRYRGTVPGGSDVLVSEASGHWSLDVGGHRAARTRAFGWANRYPADGGGRAVLSYGTPLLRYVALLGELALWVFVLRALVRARRRERFE
jgi:hypothetical protein